MHKPTGARQRECRIVHEITTDIDCIPMVDACWWFVPDEVASHHL